MANKLSFFWHLLFRNSKGYVASFLFAFIVSSLFGFSFSVKQGLLNKSAENYNQADANSFVVTKQVSFNSSHAHSLNALLMLTQQTLDAALLETPFANRIQNTQIAIGYSNVSLSTDCPYEQDMIYIPLGYNPNSFGNFSLSPLLDESHYFSFHLSGNDYSMRGMTRQETIDITPFLQRSFITRETLVHSSRSLFEATIGQGESVNSIEGIATVHLQDTFTEKDSRYLEDSSTSSNVVIPTKFSSCFEKYRDANGAYDPIDLLEKILFVLFIFLAVLLLSCLSLSCFLILQKKKPIIDYFRLLGISQKEISGVIFLKELLALLLGISAFFLLYGIFDGIFLHTLGFETAATVAWIIPFVLLVVSGLVFFLTILFFFRKRKTQLPK